MPSPRQEAPPFLDGNDDHQNPIVMPLSPFNMQASGIAIMEKNTKVLSKTSAATDTDGTSDSSSQGTPRVYDIMHAGKARDDSIVVDCHANPSEVIVKGKSMRKIQVKFPHPPNLPKEELARTSTRKRVRVLQSPGTNNSSSTTKTMDKTTIEGTLKETLPYPHEETSSPGVHPHEHILHHQDSAISLHSHETVYGSSCLSHSSSLVDLDVKFKHDVLVGMEYFEKRSSELKDQNNRMVQELDIMRRQLRSLEDDIERLEKDNKSLMQDCEEIKIKMDQSEKENGILHNQAVSEWQNRVEIEEKFIKLQNDSTKEIEFLKTQLANLKSFSDTLPNVHPKAQIKLHVSTASVGGGELSLKKTGTSEDNLELLHTITKLKDEMHKLTRERNGLADNSNRLRQEAADAKTLAKEKTRELDSQYKRYLTLKKSFNDVNDEIDKLKSQLRARGSSHLHLANTTWPLAPSKSNKKAEINAETVCYIDLPKGTRTVGSMSTSGSQQQQQQPQTSTKLKPQRVTPMVTHNRMHTRTKSESFTLPQNLPPVSNS